MIVTSVEYSVSVFDMTSDYSLLMYLRPTLDFPLPAVGQVLVLTDADGVLQTWEVCKVGHGWEPDTGCSFKMKVVVSIHVKPVKKGN